MEQFLDLLIGGQDYALYAVTMIFGFVGAFYMWVRQTQKGLKKTGTEFSAGKWLKENWKRVLWGTSVPATLTIFVFVRFSAELFALFNIPEYSGSATPFLGLLIGLGHEALAKLLDRATSLFESKSTKE
jgi:hypothetical protein